MSHPVFSGSSKASKVLRFLRKILRNVRGVILIEFAVCMPILILLLFGLHDIFRMARLQDRTNLIAHEVVSMIQNVSQGRLNKTITREDLADVGRFASYSIYPGKSQYNMSGAKHLYSHIPSIRIYYIKGESEGKASVIWKCYYQPRWLADNTRWAYSTTNWSNETSTVKKGTKVSPSQIYPTLKISEGEVKIIVEACIYREGKYGTTEGVGSSEGMVYPDGTPPSSAKQLFDLYLLTPPEMISGNAYAYFHSVAIFTPKRGLFNESLPPLRASLP